MRHKGLPAAIEAEFEEGRTNKQVGTQLLFENDRVKVWEVALEPGERAPVHCHDQDYFWTCVEPGEGIQHVLGHGDTAPRMEDLRYERGDTTFRYYRDGHYDLHDLENVGSTRLRFVTVELQD